MTRGKRYDFEGEQLTVAEIKTRVSCLSAETIRRHLDAGRNTAQAMLSFDISRARSASGRRNAVRARAAGNEPSCIRRQVKK